MKSNRCTILINSCDAFSDVWDLFFAGLKYQWSECMYPLMLNTESKDYLENTNVKVCHFSVPGKKDCWGKRYKNALKNIDTPYVMPLLEDFVIKEKFEGEALLETVMDYMDADPTIGVFYLYKHPYVKQEKTEYEGFGILPDNAKYKLTTAVGIWRKEYLDKCIKGIESPWEWEEYASKRAWRFHEKEYAMLEGEKEPYIFPYGGVIRRGLWHTETPELAQKYNVDIDFNVRGFMDVNDPFRKGREYSIRKEFPKGVFTLIFWTELRKKIYQTYRKALCKL